MLNGMAIFKPRRPKSEWPSSDSPNFYDTYYLKLRSADGKQLFRNTFATTKEAAAKVEAAAKAKIKAEGWQALMDALEPTKARQTGAKLGCIADAYMDGAVQILRDEKHARCNVASLFRIAAEALGIWTVAGRGLRGVAPGTRIPDTAKIRQLPATVLTAELVRGYFRSRQGGTELDVSTRSDGNRSINSTLGHARDVFSRKAMSYKLGKLKLPNLDGFLKEPTLPEADAEPEPLTGEEWRAMIEAAAVHPDRELILVNRILRVTGMRSAEVVSLHRSWLVREGNGWAIEIRDRKEERDETGRVAVPAFSQKGVKNRRVPLPTDLFADLDKRAGYLIAPDLAPTPRANLVNRDHNAFVKAIIGGTGERTQGNHRLRDTVCSALWSLYGPSAAQEAAGHVDPKTTSKHYAKRMAKVPPTIAAEMLIWASG